MKIASKSFTARDALCDWVNDNQNVVEEIISINTTSTMFILFYKEKTDE